MLLVSPMIQASDEEEQTYQLPLPIKAGHNPEPIEEEAYYVPPSSGKKKYDLDNRDSFEFFVTRQKMFECNNIRYLFKWDYFSVKVTDLDGNLIDSNMFGIVNGNLELDDCNVSYEVSGVRWLNRGATVEMWRNE